MQPIGTGTIMDYGEKGAAMITKQNTVCGLLFLLLQLIWLKLNKDSNFALWLHSDPYLSQGNLSMVVSNTFQKNTLRSLQFVPQQREINP